MPLEAAAIEPRPEFWRMTDELAVFRALRELDKSPLEGSLLDYLRARDDMDSFHDRESWHGRIYYDSLLTKLAEARGRLADALYDAQVAGAA